MASDGSVEVLPNGGLSVYHRPSSASLPGYGEKSIGFKSSLCLVINNVMGPAMVALPLLNQRAGWFPCVFVTTLCCACAAFSSTMLCDALQNIPGNRSWDGVNPRTGQRWEFCDAVDYFWGKKLRRIVRILFNVSLQAQNIAAMVVSCQVLDDFFRRVCGVCFSVRYDVWPLDVTTGCELHEAWAVTIGFMACMLICVPFGFLNLDQNMHFQLLSCVFLFILIAEFLCQFIIMGPYQGYPLVPSRTPFATVTQEKTLGVILFSYCFASTCPSWVNEKSHTVSCNKVIWISATIGLILKVTVGLFGSWAYELATRKNQQDAQNILLVIDHSKGGGMVTLIAAYLFNFTTLIPGIPVIAVIVRYNLLSSGRFGTCISSFLGVVVPWIITMFLYRTTLFVDILNWAAMLCMGPVNFVVPPLLYVSSVRQRIRPAQSGELEKEASTVWTSEGSRVRDVQAVKLWFGISPTLLAQLVAGVMGTLVTATICVNVYVLVVLGKDIVD